MVTHAAGTRLGQVEIVPYFLPQQPHTLIMPNIETLIDQDTYERFAELYPTDRGAG